MTITYSRKTAATQLGISDVAIGKRIRTLISKHDCEQLILDSDNRITEQGLELVRMWGEDRSACKAAIDQALALEATFDAEIEDETTTTEQPAGALTIADRCSQIAANVGTVEVMDATPYEQRATAARSALAKFVEARNARSQKLANNAATKRRTIEQIAAEHAVGDLMTYSDIYDRVLTEGMQATQAASVDGLDAMGKHAAAVE